MNLSRMFFLEGSFQDVFSGEFFPGHLFYWRLIFRMFFSRGLIFRMFFSRGLIFRMFFSRRLVFRMFFLGGLYPVSARPKHE